MEVRPPLSPPKGEDMEQITAKTKVEKRINVEMLKYKC
jgi:hypothetical protein